MRKDAEGTMSIHSVGLVFLTRLVIRPLLQIAPGKIDADGSDRSVCGCSFWVRRLLKIYELACGGKKLQPTSARRVRHALFWVFATYPFAEKISIPPCCEEKVSSCRTLLFRNVASSMLMGPPSSALQLYLCTYTISKTCFY